MSPGLMNAAGSIARAGLEPMAWLISVAGSSFTPNWRSISRATASRNAAIPLSAYPRFSGRLIWSAITRRTLWSAISSFSPMPKSINGRSGCSARARRLARLIFSNL